MAPLQLRRLAAGRGRPIVLSHALGLELRMWEGIAPALAAFGPVWAYDHRGHGRSAPRPGDATLADYVADAIEVIDAIGAGPVAWVGLSLGGMVGQGLAIRHPVHIERLVLAHTVARYDDVARAAWAARIAAVERGGLAAVADLVVQRYLQPAFRAAQPQAEAALRGWLAGTDAASYRQACRAIAAVDWLDGLPAVRCPTLVVSGALDAGAPPAAGRAIADAIPGAGFVVLPEASHLGPLECPDAFVAALRPLFAGRA